jgi:acetylornithine deacetylase/succinyl-diaminopimelate desuccinylase-like protein
MQDARLAGVPAGDESDLPPDIFTATVDLLEELTAISSPSGDAAGLGRIAARLAAELASRGLTAEVRRGLEGHANGERDRAGADPRAQPVLHARGPAGPAGGGASPGGHLLLLGHFDTVLPAAPPRRTAERLAATGAVDMKGGLAAFIGALDLLARRGVAPPDNLLLVAVPDEEVGGELSRAAVARWGEQARAVWVL